MSKAFHTVRLGVESDVRFRNEQLPKTATPFQAVFESGVLLVFIRTARTNRAIRFSETEVGITVTDESTGDHKVIVEGKITLNDDGQCRLRVGNKDLEFWQFRRSALEAILFEPVL